MSAEELAPQRLPCLALRTRAAFSKVTDHADSLRVSRAQALKAFLLEVRRKTCYCARSPFPFSESHFYLQNGDNDPCLPRGAVRILIESVTVKLRNLIVTERNNYYSFNKCLGKISFVWLDTVQRTRDTSIDIRDYFSHLELVLRGRTDKK